MFVWLFFVFERKKSLSWYWFSILRENCNRWQQCCPFRWHRRNECSWPVINIGHQCDYQRGDESALFSPHWLFNILSGSLFMVIIALVVWIICTKTCRITRENYILLYSYVKRVTGIDILARLGQFICHRVVLCVVVRYYLNIILPQYPDSIAEVIKLLHEIST